MIITGHARKFAAKTKGLNEGEAMKNYKLTSDRKHKFLCQERAATHKY